MAGIVLQLFREGDAEFAAGIYFSSQHIGEGIAEGLSRIPGGENGRNPAAPGIKRNRAAAIGQHHDHVGIGLHQGVDGLSLLAGQVHVRQIQTLAVMLHQRNKQHGIGSLGGLAELGDFRFYCRHGSGIFIARRATFIMRDLGPFGIAFLNAPFLGSIPRQVHQFNPACEGWLKAVQRRDLYHRGHLARTAALRHDLRARAGY